MILDTRNRYPWAPEEDAFILRAKSEHARHKTIARVLGRSPRAIDQHVAVLKERGVLA